MDTTNPQQSANVAKTFSTHIYPGIKGFKNSEADSVLEFLYIAYADIQGQDPKELKQHFAALNKHLEVLSLEENNEIFTIVCNICSAYEKRAFLDAIQIGVCLMLELQGN